jgi:prevent-host-death family protein
MSTINLSEAKAHLGRYLQRVEKGETVIICERNKPIARLAPLAKDAPGKTLRLGIWKGQFRVPKNFNAPVQEFERDFYGSSK